MFKAWFEDIDSYFERDPALRSRVEVLLCYPGFHALALHRLAHWLWHHRLKLLARCLSHVARMFTGIEIHPAATIGEALFIDHGHGVVIGETARIGNRVTLYHDVTLGGTSLRSGIRHPQIADDVIIGAGAQVLGPVQIGRAARVGANAVVVSDVAAEQTVVGIPARVVGIGDSPEAHQTYTAYGTPTDVAGDDGGAQKLTEMAAQIAQLKQRIEQLEAKE